MPGLVNISNLSILTSMITPAVLILACSSLILATSQRLSRAMDRTRQLNEELSGLRQSTCSTAKDDLFRLLSISLRRSRLLQKSLAALYGALSIFIGVSFTLGIIDLTDIQADWLPVLLGIIGVSLLFYSSILLIEESRQALQSITVESDLILDLNKAYHGKAKISGRGRRLRLPRKEKPGDHTQH